MDRLTFRPRPNTWRRIPVLACLAATAGAAELPERIESLAQLPAAHPLAQRITALPPEARARADAWLARMRAPRLDLPNLRVTGRGDVFITCPAPAAMPAYMRDPALPAVAEAAPVVARAAVPIASPPIYHSKPGSTRRLVLNLSG